MLNIKPVYQRGMELDPGRYNIRVSHPGYVTKTEWVELVGGRENLFNVFRFSLDKVPVGRVVVRSEPPGARFDIGGKFAGTTPAEVKDAPAGSYEISISKNGYEDWWE